MKFLKKIYLFSFILLSLINASNASDKDLFPLEKMPKSILSHLASFLSVKDILKLSRTNKTFYKLICGDKENESKICIYQKTTPNNLLGVDYTKFTSIKETNHGKCALKYFIGTLENCDTKIFENISFEEILNSKNLHTIEFKGFPSINLSKINLETSDRILSLIKLNPQTQNLCLAETNIYANKYFPSFYFSSSLKWLDLNNNDLGRMGKNFLSLKFPDSLTYLSLTNTNLAALGKYFISIKWPSSLETLNLSDNALGKGVGKHLKDVIWPERLGYLTLNNNHLGDLEKEFIAIEWPASLETLCLENNNLGNLGKYFILIKWPSNSLLLYLSYNKLAKGVGEHLKDVKWPSNLNYLSVKGRLVLTEPPFKFENFQLEDF